MIINRLSSLLAYIFWSTNVFVKSISAYYEPLDMNHIDPITVTREEIENALKIYGIIPDVLTSAPPYFAKVTFGPRVCPRIGQQVEAHLMRYFPLRMEWPGRDNDYFTIILVDPDAPSKAAPYEREYLHWMVVNVKGRTLNTRETIVDYLRPEPLIGTGIHRYVYLVLLQPEKNPMCFNERHLKSIHGDSSRASFSARFFASRYNLEFFAVNFFRAEWVEKTPYFNYTAANRRKNSYR